jgi:hypothetical protein
MSAFDPLRTLARLFFIGRKKLPWPVFPFLRQLYGVPNGIVFNIVAYAATTDGARNGFGEPSAHFGKAW